MQGLSEDEAEAEAEAVEEDEDDEEKEEESDEEEEGEPNDSAKKTSGRSRSNLTTPASSGKGRNRRSPRNHATPVSSGTKSRGSTNNRKKAPVATTTRGNRGSGNGRTKEQIAAKKKVREEQAIRIRKEQQEKEAAAKAKKKQRVGTSTAQRRSKRVEIRSIEKEAIANKKRKAQAREEEADEEYIEDDEERKRPYKKLRKDIFAEDDEELSDGENGSDFGSDQDSRTDTEAGSENKVTVRKVRKKKIFTGDQLTEKTKQLIEKQKKFSDAAKKPMNLKGIKDADIKKEVQRVRQYEEELAEMEAQCKDNQDMGEDDWNYDEADYRTKTDVPRLADELPAGKKPRRINDLKSSGARKVHMRNMANASKFLNMAVAPNNGEKDRPVFCGGFIFLDQLKPNPANNPGGKETDVDYRRYFRKLRIVLQVPNVPAGVAFINFLRETSDDEWKWAQDYGLGSGGDMDSEELDKIEGKWLTTTNEETMKLLYGIPKTQQKKRPTGAEIRARREANENADGDQGDAKRKVSFASDNGTTGTNENNGEDDTGNTVNAGAAAAASATDASTSLEDAGAQPPDGGKSNGKGRTATSTTGTGCTADTGASALATAKPTDTSTSEKAHNPDGTPGDDAGRTATSTTDTGRTVNQGANAVAATAAEAATNKAVRSPSSSTSEGLSSLDSDEDEDK